MSGFHIFVVCYISVYIMTVDLNLRDTCVFHHLYWWSNLLTDLLLILHVYAGYETTILNYISNLISYKTLTQYTRFPPSGVSNSESKMRKSKRFNILSVSRLVTSLPSQNRRHRHMELDNTHLDIPYLKPLPPSRKV